MKKNYKVKLSFLMIFLMLFSIGAYALEPLNHESNHEIVKDTVYDSVYGGEDQDRTIRVRVEGKDETLFDKDVVIGNCKNALEILKKAVGEENVKGEEGAYGFLIQGIKGEEANWKTNGAFWGFYTVVDGETSESMSGVSDVSIEGLDEVLFHVNQNTNLPILSYEKNNNEIYLIIKESVTTYDKNGNSTTSIVPVENAKLEIEGKIYVTNTDGKVKVDLKSGSCIVKISKDEENEYPKLIKCTKKIQIGTKRIEILSHWKEVTIGNELKLDKKVYEEENILDEAVKWYSTNPEIASVDENTGIVKGIKEGKTIITAKLASNENIYTSIEISVESPKTNERKIEEVLNTLRARYEKKESFTLSEGLGYKYSNKNIDKNASKVKEKYKLIPNTSVTSYAKNIIGLIETGQDSKNMVTELLNKQTTDSKFIVNGWDDYPSTQAYCILALDLAKAKYEVEKTVKSLLKYQNTDGTFGEYKDIDTLAMSMMGLSNHRDIEGVNEAIQKAIHKLQLEKENIINNDNANTLATVIQGLVSVGENPLASQWKLDQKTMLNAMLKYQNEDHFGNDLATEQVFTALSDLYQKQSMYTKKSISIEGFGDYFIPTKNDGPGSGGGSIEEGDEASISIKGYNNDPNISKTQIKLQKGDTVLSVTKRLLKDKNISYELNDTETYFKRIGKYGEFSQGAKSGWEYTLNGERVQKSVNDCSVKNKDEIKWIYTIDYTKGSSASEPKDEMTKEIDKIQEILNNKNINEGDITKTVKNVINQLNKKAEDIKTEEDAKKLVFYGKEFSNSIQHAIEQIKSEEAAKGLLKDNIKILNILAKSTEKLSKKENQKEVNEVVSKNIHNMIQLINKVEDKKEVVSLTGNIIDESGKVLKSIGKENGEEVEKSTIKMAQNTIDQCSMLQVKKVEYESEKSLAQLDENTIKKTAKDIVNATKDIKEKLNKNSIESKNIENKMMIQIPNTNKKEVEVRLPSNMMKIVKENKIEKVTIQTENAVFNMTANTLIQKDQPISLSAKAIDQEDLTAFEKNKVPKESIVLDLNIKMGEEKINQFHEPMKVAIPYDGEVKDQEVVQVFYLNDKGTIENMGGEYDQDTKMVTFEISHFSKYFAQKLEKEEVKITFHDLKDYEWAKESIEEMAEKGIIHGKSKDLFDPSASITRAEFATLITKMLQLDIEDIHVSFTDVEDSDWYAPYVKAAYKNGFISGRSATIFDPNGKITREEMASIIGKVLTQKGKEKANINELEKFIDKESIAPWANENAALCVKESIISGMPDGTFMPKENANRAQAAVMLYKLYNSIK
ncbi:S-layer homology domain-containing protein [Inediibacterium massiliense]|uniref:S-layer homology domain-containing protein n=1 Tax=Inediibacterium massiliense TaxID=1658111 RepID=UPI0006B4E5AE|nr:S-layer homology domain-containing protein [Inediibacterium massiliense]